MRIASLLAGLSQDQPINLQKAFERVDEVVTRIGFGSSLKYTDHTLLLGGLRIRRGPIYSFEAFEDIQIKSRVNALDVYESEFDKGKTEL